MILNWWIVHYNLKGALPRSVLQGGFRIEYSRLCLDTNSSISLIHIKKIRWQ